MMPLFLLLAVPCWPGSKLLIQVHCARNTTRSSTDKFIHLPSELLLLAGAAAGAAADAPSGAASADAAASASVSAAA